MLRAPQRHQYLSVASASLIERYLESVVRPLRDGHPLVAKRGIVQAFTHHQGTKASLFRGRGLSLDLE